MHVEWTRIVQVKMRFRFEVPCFYELSKLRYVHLSAAHCTQRNH